MSKTLLCDTLLYLPWLPVANSHLCHIPQDNQDKYKSVIVIQSHGHLSGNYIGKVSVVKISMTETVLSYLPWPLQHTCRHFCSELPKSE
jgi:hypothetical protein